MVLTAHYLVIFTAAGLNKLYKVLLLFHFSKQQKNTHCFKMEVSV